MDKSDASLETSGNNKTPANSEAGYKPNVRPPRRIVDPAGRGLVRPEQTPAKQEQQESGQNRRGKESAETQEPRKPVSLRDVFASADENDEDFDDGTSPVKGFEQLVKRSGLKAEEVYDIEIPMPDGEPPVTLGKLKDAARRVLGVEEAESRFDLRRVEAEGQIMQAQREMRELLTAIPASAVSKELRDKLRTKHDKVMAREIELTLEHIPQWRDEKKRTEEMAAMRKFVGRWGFEESFLDNFVDHRAMKFVRDQFLQSQRIEKALAEVETDHSNKRGKRPSGKAAKAPAKLGGDRRDSRSVHQQTTSRNKIVDLFNRN